MSQPRTRFNGFGLPVAEFIRRATALELPRAFTLMSRLKERGIWQLTSDEEAALEDFWWEYGQ